MDRRIILGLMALVALAALFSVTAIAPGNIQAIQTSERNMFNAMVKNYFHPVVTGWGIGLNTEEDSYLAARFHAVSVRTLSRARIRAVIAEGLEAGDMTWAQVKDRLQNALDEEGLTNIVARIKINKADYILTGVVKDDTTFSGVIREKPDYTACTAADTSTDDCELASTQVGSMSLTRKDAEFEEGKDRVWAGTMEFQGSDYTFVALLNPPARVAAATGTSAVTKVTTRTTVKHNAGAANGTGGNAPGLEAP